MSTIFIISQSEGEYDSYSSWPVAATHDEQKAKDYVADMEQRLIKANAAREQIQQHMTTWDLANPRPYPKAHTKVTPLPSFKGPKKSWTAEQKALYKKVDEDNRAHCAAESKPFSDWCKERYEEQVRFVQSFPSDLQEDINHMGSDAMWSYEDITIIE
jgi:hypothetical protein